MSSKKVRSKSVCFDRPNIENITFDKFCKRLGCKDYFSVAGHTLYIHFSYTGLTLEEWVKEYIDLFHLSFKDE